MTFRRTTCPCCRKKMEQGQRIHPECIEPWAEAQAAKAERARAKAERMAARIERAEIRKRKEAIKTRQQWLAECQAIANKYVRVRDAKNGCISCDKPASWDGQWHGSHLRSVGSASAVRFNLWNINKSCSVCNNHLSGNIREYERRLRAKIGNEKVDWLYSQNQIKRYSIDYLKRYKTVIGRRLRRMEQRNAT